MHKSDVRKIFKQLYKYSAHKKAHNISRSV